MFIKEGYLSLPLSLEIPTTPGEFKTGLMFREKLDWNTGMLFVFNELRTSILTPTHRRHGQRTVRAMMSILSGGVLRASRALPDTSPTSDPEQRISTSLAAVLLGPFVTAEHNRQRVSPISTSEDLREHPLLMSG